MKTMTNKRIERNAMIVLLEVLKTNACTDEQRSTIAEAFDLYTEFYKVEVDPLLTDLSWAVNPALTPYKLSKESNDMAQQTKLAILAMLLIGTYTEQDRTLIATVFHLYFKQSVYTVRDEHEREVFINLFNKE